MKIKAILFDAYGTLLDVHSSVAKHADRLGSAAADISALWRQKQLEYTWTLTLAGGYRPFDALTVDALDFALARHGRSDGNLRQDLFDSYRQLAPFVDVRPALTQLKGSGIRLGILSNGTPEMLQEAVASAGIADFLDPILSVDSLKVYKPDPRVYAMAAERLDLKPHEIGFVSSNAWDAMGAQSFGFQVFQLHRQSGPDEYQLIGKTKAISSLGELAGLL
jgi:2-haloacid dehalogenase